MSIHLLCITFLLLAVVVLIFFGWGLLIASHDAEERMESMWRDRERRKR